MTVTVQEDDFVVNIGVSTAGPQGPQGAAGPAGPPGVIQSPVSQDIVFTGKLTSTGLIDLGAHGIVTDGLGRVGIGTDSLTQNAMITLKGTYAGNTAVAIYGASGQTAPLLTAGDFAVDSIGRVGIGANFSDTNLTIKPLAANQRGLVIQGAVGQTAVLQTWTNNNSTKTMTVDANANISTSGVLTAQEGALIGTTNYQGRLTVQSLFASDKTVVIRGFTGQTANLTEWQDVNGNFSTAINSAGNIEYSSVTGKPSFSANNYSTAGMIQANGYFRVTQDLQVAGTSNGGRLEIIGSSASDTALIVPFTGQNNYVLTVRNNANSNSLIVDSTGRLFTSKTQTWTNTDGSQNLAVMDQYGTLTSTVKADLNNPFRINVNSIDSTNRLAMNIVRSSDSKSLFSVNAGGSVTWLGDNLSLGEGSGSPNSRIYSAGIAYMGMFPGQMSTFMPLNVGGVPDGGSGLTVQSATGTANHTRLIETSVGSEAATTFTANGNLLLRQAIGKTFRPTFAHDRDNAIFDMDYNGIATGSTDSFAGGFFRFDLRGGGTFDIYGKPGDGNPVGQSLFSVNLSRQGATTMRRPFYIDSSSTGTVTFDVGNSVQRGLLRVFDVGVTTINAENPTNPGSLHVQNRLANTGQVSLIVRRVTNQANNLTEWQGLDNVAVNTVGVDGKFKEFKTTSLAGAGAPAIRASNVGGGDGTFNVRNWEGTGQDGTTITTWISTAGNMGAGAFGNLDRTQEIAFVGSQRINLTSPKIQMQTPGAIIQFSSPNNTVFKSIGVDNDGTFNLAANPVSSGWQNDGIIGGVKAPNGTQRTQFLESGRIAIDLNTPNGMVGWGAKVPLYVSHDGSYFAPETGPTGDLITAVMAGARRFSVTKFGNLEMPIAGSKITMTSPNGTLYDVAVGNDGALTGINNVTVTVVPYASWPPAADSNPNHWYVRAAP